MYERLKDRGGHVPVGVALLLAFSLYGCPPDPSPVPMPTPTPAPATPLRADCGNANMAYMVERGTPVTFFGTLSTTPNPPLSYNWRFGDGTSASTITPTHAYERCNEDCSGPQCTPACVTAHPSQFGFATGCCPQPVDSGGYGLRDYVMTFSVTLTVTDRTGQSASCSTTCMTTGHY